MLELIQHTKCLAAILSGVLKLGNVSENAALLSAITTDVLRVMPEFKTPDLPVVFIPDKVGARRCISAGLLWIVLVR